MAKKDYPEDLPSILGAKKAACEGYENTKLAREREEILLYYQRVLPRPHSRGSSSFCSTNVYDSVRSMHSQLKEAYSAGQDIVQFSACKPGDTEAARIATEYTKYVLFKQNDGDGIISDIILNGLLTRIGIAKVWWETSEEASEESFQGIDPLALQGLAMQDDVSELEAEGDQDEDGNPVGPQSGKLTRKKDTSQIRIECIAPEDFFVEPEARDLKTAFHSQRTLMTRAEIKAAGFDIKLIKDLNPDADTDSAINTGGYARNVTLDTTLSPNDTIMREKDKKFWLWESYLRMTSDDDCPCLYKIVSVGNVILDYEEVDRSPFIPFVPIRQANTLIGENFASLSKATQAANTMLIRAILDHTSQTTNPRYLVMAGGLPSPRELLDNRSGGIVQVKSMDSIMPMPQPPLNQYVFPILDMLKTASEETTGISSLSQGLNQDAISSQNSQGMVNDLVDMSQTRQRTIAREFANHFLVPLFIEIYQLIIENDTSRRENSIQIAGNFVQIDPTTWIARKDCDVTMHLSPTDAAQEGMRLASMLAMGAQDQAIGSMMTPQNRYNIAAKVCMLNGFRDVNSYLTPPNQLPPPPPPPGPDPVVMAQLQIQQKQADAQAMLAQAEVQKIQNDFELKKMQFQLQVEQFELQKVTKTSEMHRKEIVSISNIDAEQREIEMLEKQPPAANLTAIDTPRPAT